MLSGHAPFVGKTPFETIMRHRTDPIPQLDRQLKVPPRLEAVIRKCLSKDPEGRYPDARAMASALLEAVPALSHPELAVGDEEVTKAPPRRASRSAATMAAPLKSEDDAEVEVEEDDDDEPEAPRKHEATVVQPPPTRRPSSRAVQRADKSALAETSPLKQYAGREEPAPSSKLVLLVGILAGVAIVAGIGLYLTVTREPDKIARKTHQLPIAEEGPGPIKPRTRPDAGETLALVDEPGPDAGAPLAVATPPPDAGATVALVPAPGPGPGTHDPTPGPKPPAGQKKPPTKPGTKPKPGSKNGEAGYELEIF
jgi:serine/threonine-protein kinase